MDVSDNGGTQNRNSNGKMMINHDKPLFFWGYPILRPKKGPFYGVETVETTYCTILGKPYRLPQRSGASGGAPDARQGIHGCGARIFRQRKLTVRNFRQLLLKTSGNFVELECFGDLFDSHFLVVFWSLNLGKLRHSWCSPIALAEGLSPDKGSGWG